MNVDYGRYTKEFNDDFDHLSLRTGSGSGTWKTTYTWGDRTLPGNKEEQFYVDPAFKDLGLNPYSINGGVLTITAEPASAEIKPHINNHDYTSGMISSEGAYEQTYGYFEMSAKLPEGQGLWPAFWMLPTHRGWPPEIDIMEVLGHDTTTLYTTAHTKAGTPRMIGENTKVPDMSADFHKFSVEWTPLALTWFFDGVEIARQATAPDMHTPMYLIANLAVGGYWPGSPDSTTPFPAEMQIDYIRGYTVDDLPVDPRIKWAEGERPTKYIFGTDAVETLTGTSGSDEIKGKGQGDVLVGGLGDDRYIAGTGKIVEKPGEGIDTVRQFSASHTLEDNVENLIIEYGNTGIGNALNNRIYGNKGGNTIDGGAGDDLLFGQGGKDTFLVKRGQGSDTIGDFRADDKLVITGSHADFASLSKAMTQAGRNVEIALGDGGVLTLADVTAADLKATQFTFVDPAPVDIVPADPAPVDTTPPPSAGKPQEGKPGNGPVAGSAGNDVITVGAGSETVDGGRGFDQAVMQGGRSAYTVAAANGQLVLTAKAGGEVKTLSGVEFVSFDDGTIVTALADQQQGNVARLYEMVLDRAADVGGLQAWLKAHAGGSPLSKLAEGFLNSAEYADRYGSVSDGDFVNTLYQRGLNRDGEAAGVANWTGALANGMSRADAVVGFASSAEATSQFDYIQIVGVNVDLG